jgi:hypothetical protein
MFKSHANVSESCQTSTAPFSHVALPREGLQLAAPHVFSCVGMNRRLPFQVHNGKSVWFEAETHSEIKP